MALAKMTYDELNQLVGYKISEPFEEFFEPMRFSRERKLKRIAIAEELEEIFLAMLVECFYAEQIDSVVSADIINRTRDRYANIIRDYIDGYVAYEYLVNHGTAVISDAIATLYRHRDDPFYYSADRARAIAENDSNSIWNYTEYEEAVRNKHNKTWHTVMDGHERDSHAEVNGKTLPINEPFHLQGGDCQYPRDESYGMSDEEIINCRCWLTFS